MIDKKAWFSLRERALLQTRKQVAASVTDDQLIIQAINAVEELDRHANTLVRRLREWFELLSPEFSHAVADNEAFVRLVLQKRREDQLKEQRVVQSMGADLPEADVRAILGLASTIKSLFDERSQLDAYLARVLNRHCPNVVAIAGPTIAARLLKEAGSLRRLATIQAGTIQLYGAEKALFRHLKTGARPPKHGHLVNHPLVMRADRKHRGRVARALADKISIAARVDYFKGAPLGKRLREELEARFT